MTTPNAPDPIWIIMPIAGAREYTDAAISDCLAQTIPTRLLLINQGVDYAFRCHLESLAEHYEDRILLWSHNPPLPSLAATWNRALRCVWESGGEVALVVNNDVRLSPVTVDILETMLVTQFADFVSAVGVTAEQFVLERDVDVAGARLREDGRLKKGGPDFSCFLLSKAGHTKYPFDEGFIPAYCEDLDTHRRYMLGGDGDKIFSVNLPYLHYASGTLKSLDPPDRARKERAIDQSRAYYARKWGGSVNHERFAIPFDPESAQDGVTTPELQRKQQEGAAV